MRLVERHVIKQNHPYFQECDRLCFLSKNLYNATLYVQRQSFFNGSFRNYYDVNNEFTHNNQVDYRSLPAKVSKMTQQLVQQNFNSFFALLKKARENDYDKPIKLPKYLDKNGRQVITYPKQALSFQKEGFVKLSKTNIFIKYHCHKESITNVRIVPKGNHYVIEVGYTCEPKTVDPTDFTKVAFIDPGLNNLLTVTSNVFTPIIYSGRLAKSINQLYNKEVAKYKKILPRGIYWSRQLQGITNKRNFRIHDLFHKISTDLVNYLVSNNIKTVIFGHNIGQKQNIELGKRNNQNFTQIPFTKIIQMISYKCEKQGIQFIETEESYTSKCSFLDGEPIKKHERYKGLRVKRGLFQSSNKKIINADVNGSLNIGRKYLEKKLLYSNKLHLELLSHLHSPQIREISLR